VGKSRIASLPALLVACAISLPLLASCTSAGVTRSRTATRQLAELKGSDTVASDEFGVSVAVSGTKAVVGTSGAAYAGRAYVFAKSASGWTQVAELKGSDTVAADRFGASVAISGTTVVVGAYDHAKDAGRAYVFTETASGWKRVFVLKGSDTVTGDNFGTSVAISPTTAIVGAYGRADNAGRAYVFAKDAALWKQTAELRGSDTTTGDYFGISTAISGTSVVVGAYDHAKDAGRAYVFAKTASGWKETAELKGSDTVAEDYFGSSVAVSGTTAVTGSYGQAKYAGRAYVFKS
jgi:hypothetical protein